MSLGRSRKTIKLVAFILLVTLFILLTKALIRGLYYYPNSPSWHFDGSPSTVANTPVQTPSKLQRKPSRLGKHRYRPDGLLEVNEEGIHPVYELVFRAEKEWREKLERASKTLQDAVVEYRRRYKRPPPKGFDLWWTYAKEHNIQLPDEYDQIYNDLEGFYGIEPEDLIKIHEENERKKDSYTIGKNKTGNIEVVTYAFEEGKHDQLIVGAKDIISLFDDIKDYLPPFRMTMSPHDSPNRMTDYGVKTAALEAAVGQTYIERTMLPKTHKLGWVSACSPDSPARRKPINLDNPPARSTKKTFIYNHPLAMDPCNHPGLFYHHGQFLSHNLGPNPQDALVPEFSYCSTTIHHNIRFPASYEWVEDLNPRGDDPKWPDKVEERLLWRGSTTGVYHSATSRWKASHRNFLVSLANDMEGTLMILPPNRTRDEKVGEPREVRKARINPAVLDVAFFGADWMIQCDPDVCRQMEEMYTFRDWQSFKEAGRYKYVIDIDGNGWSGRFKRLMTSNALVFKATIYPEWYADRVAPWVHYIPIQIDLSDLHDALVFFRGDGNGDGAHENLAHKIAVAGRQWSKNFWRKEDLTSYLFRLTLEYARLMSTDRDAMSYSDFDEHS